MNRLVDNHYAMDPMRRSFDRYDGALKSTAGSSEREKTYEMPDGNVFNIDDERFRCAEVLFQPSCIGKEASGIHDKSLQSIMAFDEAPYKTGREITLKSDTERAIIACRNRVAEACKAEVTTEDAVKADKESNGLIENAVMLIRGIIRTIKCHIGSRTQEPLSDDSLVMPWLVEHAGCILSRCQKGRDGRTPFERLHGKKPPREFVPFGERESAG